jgi:eukaryotic-like serine/threonine-protein kinase
MISTIGQYKILERLGGGALGDVFRARDTRAGRTIALMVPPAELIASPAQRERFLEDARKAARLNHPNIAMLFDVLEQDDRCYLAYEFAAGPSLTEEMGGAALDVSHACHLAAHIADALAGGHAQGIVHGDLRPDTIVVTPKGSVKVLNFGMTTWTTGGVVAYRAPELRLGSTGDERSDLFALGVVFYEMLTGRQPSAGAAAPSSVKPELPAELDAVVTKLLAREPAARYQAAAAVAADIRRVSGEVDVKLNDRLRRAAALKRRSMLAAVAIASVVILLTHGRC